MAQVALNWAVNQPSISSVLVGASKIHQLEDNLKALEFELSDDDMRRLTKASSPDVPFPYFFFDGVVQNMVHGNSDVGSNHHRYARETLVIAPEQSEEEQDES